MGEKWPLATHTRWSEIVQDLWRNKSEDSDAPCRARSGLAALRQRVTGGSKENHGNLGSNHVRA